MFRLFKKKIPLVIGQIWETENKNPFRGKWRAKITNIKDGYVEYFAYYESKDEKTKKFLENIKLQKHSHKEKDFRFFHSILVSE